MEGAKTPAGGRGDPGGACAEEAPPDRPRKAKRLERKSTGKFNIANSLKDNKKMPKQALFVVEWNRNGHNQVKTYPQKNLEVGFILHLFAWMTKKWSIRPSGSAYTPSPS